MNREGASRLLKAVLNTQVEAGCWELIREERLKEALTKGPPLSESERAILLLSPLARDEYQRVKNSVLKSVNARMDANRVDTSLVSLAASSLEDKVILKGRSFAVTLYRGLGRDVPWVVLVQLDKNYLDAIEPMTTLRLVDSGGMEWMRGSVDSNGEFTGVWLPSNGDLIKRAQDYSLSLVPE